MTEVCREYGFSQTIFGVGDSEGFTQQSTRNKDLYGEKTIVIGNMMMI